MITAIWPFHRHDTMITNYYPAEKRKESSAIMKAVYFDDQAGVARGFGFAMPSPAAKSA